MKKGRQASNSIEDGKDHLKYKSLLAHYLQIQKECFSKKRKLQAKKRKRNKLVQEVRFLRQKYKYFTETPTHRNSQNKEDIHDVPIGKEIAIQTDLKQESNDREEEVVEKSVGMNLSINGKKSKKKVSWDENVVVYSYPRMDLVKKLRKCKKI